MSERAERALTLVLLTGVAAAVYLPSLSNGFLQDDESNIIPNEALASPSQWPRFLYDPSSHTADPRLAVQTFRPLTVLSFALNRAAGGLEPFGYHAADVLLHVLNTVLVFFAASLVLGGGSAALAPSAGAALLFCVHPAQAESVSYISGARPNALSLAFCLSALFVHAGGRTASRKAVGAAAFLAALLSKESAIVLPLLLAAYDRIRRPSEPAADVFRSLLPHAAVAAFYLLWRHLALGQTAQIGPWGGSWAIHTPLALLGLAQDFAIALWPTSLRMCYSFPEADLFGRKALVSALSLGLAAAATYWALRRRRPWGFPAAFFLVPLIPVSNIVPIAAFAADRFLHMPLVGLALLWAMLLTRLRAGSAGLAAAGLTFALLPANVERQLAWRNQFTCHLEAAAAAPTDPCAKLYLASQYLRWGMFERAEGLAASGLGTIQQGPRARRILARVHAQRAHDEAQRAERATGSRSSSSGSRGR